MPLEVRRNRALVRVNYGQLRRIYMQQIYKVKGAIF